MDNTYLFIGGPASGKRIHVPFGTDGKPHHAFVVPRISAAHYASAAYVKSEAASHALYHRKLFTIESYKRYMFVWEGFDTITAFDLLVERFPK